MEIETRPGIFRYCKGKWIDQKEQYENPIAEKEKNKLIEQAEGNQRKVIKVNQYRSIIITVDKYDKKNNKDKKSENKSE